MTDAIYVAATIGFFALMLAYTRGCEALGAGAAAAHDQATGPADR